MTLFRFEAFAPSGQTIDGVIEADTLPDALSVLRQRGLSPFVAEQTSSSVQPSAESITLPWHRLGLEWRSRIIRQLATLLAAGITLDRALHILATQASRPKEQNILDGILNQVLSGRPLSTAISGSSSQFRADEVGLIKAGEQSGSLVSVLEELSTLLERRQQLKGKLVSALIYPAFLLALAPISLVIIAAVLVPNIAPLFENSGASMPFALRAMIWASEKFHTHGLIWLLATLCLVALTYITLRNNKISGRAYYIISAFPIVRTIRKRTDASRICRTLGSLQIALSTVTEVTTDSGVQSKLRAARDAVSGGEKLAKALKIIPSLDSTALQMIAIGEETNKLETMLLYIADAEEKALANYVDRLMTLLTPVMTIIMGLLVGGIVMSIMKAILSVNELAAK
jgi:general secretion pathway protein F